MWAYVNPDDSTTTEHVNLPSNWRNISNFFAMENDLEALAALGWYPLVDDTVPLTSDLVEYHGPATYTLDEINDVVRKKCEVIQKEGAGINPAHDFAQARGMFFNALRQRRDQLLRESDWTQVTDLQSIKPDQWKLAWAQYRQQLRDLPEQYENPPLDEAIDFDQIAWPQVPTGV